jgi:phosphatidylglycerol lysyltransferase
MRLRRLFFWLLIIAFVWVITGQIGNAEKVNHLFWQGQWQWVLLALGLQGIYQLLQAWLFQAAFAAVGVPSGLRDLLRLTLAARFVHTTAPSGGTGGMALFVDDAVQRGQSGARAAAGTLVKAVADYSAFSIILTAGMVALVTLHDLKVYEVALALGLYLYLAGIAVLLGLGLWQPLRLYRWFYWLANQVNHLGGWFRYPALLQTEWPERNALEFARAARSLVLRPTYLAGLLGLALLAHLTCVGTLYTLFWAFNLPTTIAMVIAGYAMTGLFTLVAPTPNGIGVVEGLLPIVYGSLGLKALEAVLITLVYRVLAFWLPLLIGFVLVQRSTTFHRPQHTWSVGGQVQLIAWLTGLMGILNVLSAARPALADRAALLAHFSPLAVQHGSNLAAVLAGFALLLLANGLAHRKHSAWLLTLAVLFLSALSHLLKGLDYEEAAIALGIVGYMLWYRDEFHALSDRPSLWQGVQVILLAFVFTLGYSAFGFYLLDRHYHIQFGLRAAIRQTIIMFTQFYDPGLQPITGFGRYFADSIYIVGASTLGFGLFMLLRPVLVRQPATASQRTQARQLVEAHGRSVLARLVLLPDKSYYFSPGGAVIGYAVRSGVAVALGDPIGPDAEMLAAIQGFQRYAQRHGWRAAFYQTLPDHLAHYQAAGLDVVRVGHEAVVDLATFTLTGGANKPLRNAINRLTKLGQRAVVLHPPYLAELLSELEEISDEWLTMLHSSEKRFSVGWFDRDYLGEGPIAVVYTASGEISAFANIVRGYQRNEASVDLMRRRADLENGTMDLLFVTMLDWAKQQGFATFNLGLSAFSGIGEQPTDPALEKAMNYIYEHLDQFYNFKGLHEYKEKFHPHWEPRYLAYPGVVSLPAVLAALVRLGSGENLWDDLSKGLEPLWEHWRKPITTPTPTPVEQPPVHSGNSSD